MVDWDNLEKTPEWRAMWTSKEMRARVSADTRALTENHKLSETDRLYKQGFLAGIKFIKEFPERMLVIQDAQRGTDIAPEGEPSVAEKLRRMVPSGLRFRM